MAGRMKQRYKPPTDKQIMKGLSTAMYSAEKKGLLLHGSDGVGKSHGFRRYSDGSVRLFFHVSGPKLKEVKRKK